MTLEEVARLRLEIMGDEAEQTLESLQKSAKEINSELRLMELNGEKGSETWKELKNVQRDVNAEIREMGRNLDINDANMNELQATSRQLNRELANLKIGSEEWIDKLKEISQVDEKITETRAEMRRLKDDGEEQTSFWSNFGANFAAAFTVEAVMQAASAVFEFGKEIFEITAKFEKYETVLKTALGGQAEAVAAMEMIKEIAATTPVSVDEMTDSFIKMVNRGIKPTQEEIKNLADLSSSQGKEFDMLIEAVLDAQQGENERLKEFGISADKVGDQVILGFKGKQVAVEQSSEAIYKAIVAMGDYNGVAGMTSTMTETLGGKASNLGDSFDFLLVKMGDELKPVFNAVLDFLGSAVEWFGRVVSGTEPMSVALRGIGTIFGMIWDIGKTLVEIFFPQLSGQSITVESVLRILGNTLTVVVATLKAVVATIQVGVDSFKVMSGGVSALSKALSGDFSGAAKTFISAVDNLTGNAKKNFTSIKGDFEKVFSGSEKVAKEATKQVDIYGKLAKDTEGGITKKALEEQEKREKAAVAANKKSNEEIRKNNLKTLDDDIVGQLKAENLKYEAALKRIQNSKASEGQKLKEIQSLEAAHLATVGKLQEEADKKKEQLLDRWVTSSYDKELKKLQNVYNKELENAQKSFTVKEEFDKFKANLDKYYSEQKKALVDAEEAHETKARDKKIAEEKKARDQKLKDDKVLLDAGFQAEIEQAKLSLSLTTANSQAQHKAKIDLLEAEKKYRDQKLKDEATAEKNRVTDSIADETRRAEAHKSIDDKLKSQLDQNEQKLKTDRIAAQKATDEARKQSNEEFLGWLKKAQDGDFKGFTTYLADRIKDEKANLKGRDQENVSFFSAMKAAMTGDFKTFTTFLAQKTKDESVFNKQSFQDFNNKTQAIGQVAQAGIQALQSLNKAYLEKQQANIKKEKDTQLAAWKEKYDKGLVSKEDYEKGVEKINKDSDNKTKQVQKEAFERDKKLQIAMALVAGALAFVKALASGFFPVNLVMAAATAVATGLQVAMIKRQAFSGAKGGVIRNAGVVQGGQHGQQYGDGGISMVDRKTGNEVGEIEGGEPVMILSRNTYKNNKPVVDRLLHSSLHRNGAPIMKNGGIVTLGQAMFKDGGIYEESASDEAGRGSYSSSEESNSYDTGSNDYGGGGGYSDSETGAPIDNSDAEARIAENTALQKEQLQAIKNIEQGIGILAMLLREGNSEARNQSGLLNDIKNKPTGPSLHDIVSNIGGMIAANNKSNL